jgi:hypothetical protein
VKLTTNLHQAQRLRKLCAILPLTQIHGRERGNLYLKYIEYLLYTGIKGQKSNQPNLFLQKKTLIKLIVICRIAAADLSAMLLQPSSSEPVTKSRKIVLKQAIAKGQNAKY